MIPPTLSVAWISYRDDALLRKSLESVAPTGLRTTVLRNGPSPHPIDLPGVSKVVELRHVLNLADAFRRLFDEIDTDFILLMDTDMRLLDPEGSVLASLVAECPPDVAMMVLPESGIDGRTLHVGTTIPRRLTRTMAPGTPTRAFPLGGVIYRRRPTIDFASPTSQLDWGDHDLDLALAARRRGYTWIDVDGPWLEHDVFNASKPQLGGRVYRALCSRYQTGTNWTGEGNTLWMGLSSQLLAGSVRSMVRGRGRPSDVARLALDVALSGLTRRRVYLPPLAALESVSEPAARAAQL